MKGPFAAAAFALLAACAVEPASVAPVDATSPPVVIDATAPVAASVASTDITPLVALDSEGLRMVDPENGNTRLIGFGSDAPATVLAVARATPGAPPGEPVLDECGGSVFQLAGGLQVHTRDGIFLGWGLDPESRHTTMAGIGIGSTRDELEAVQAADVVPDSTLGVEFSSDGIAGLLESDAPQARITHLWAGETCIAR
jgi:hypothetical protein